MDTLICAAMLLLVLAATGGYAASQIRAVRRHRAGGGR